jgi:hypothetical protein
MAIQLPSVFCISCSYETLGLHHSATEVFALMTGVVLSGSLYLITNNRPMLNNIAEERRPQKMSLLITFFSLSTTTVTSFTPSTI